ncbi:MAG: hypothetical protein ACXVCP_09110 [Bdellovibrio sp.]
MLNSKEIYNKTYKVEETRSNYILPLVVCIYCIGVLIVGTSSRNFSEWFFDPKMIIHFGGVFLFFWLSYIWYRKAQKYRTTVLILTKEGFQKEFSAGIRFDDNGKACLKENFEILLQEVFTNPDGEEIVSSNILAKCNCTNEILSGQKVFSVPGGIGHQASFIRIRFAGRDSNGKVILNFIIPKEDLNP